MTIFKNVLLGVLLATGMFGTSPATSAPVDTGPNLIANGDFESGLVDWTPSGFVAEGYDYGVDDAGLSGSQAFYGGGVGAPGFLSQTIATVPGLDYLVSFWLASDGFLPNELQIVWNGAVVFDQVDTLLQDFAPITFDVTASTATTLFEIGARDDSGFLHVDDVSVAAVSEPATVALVAIGLSFVVRRRRGGKDVGASAWKGMPVPIS